MMRAEDYAKNQVIKNICVEEHELRIEFVFGSRLRVWDAGQSCCESRYMHTDDDLAPHIGATFQGIEVRDTSEKDIDDFTVQEVQFLVVTTSRGQFTVANYNEHNGYYGGFSITTVYDGIGGQAENQIGG